MLLFRRGRVSFDVVLEIVENVFLLLSPNASSSGVSFILRTQVLRQDWPPRLHAGRKGRAELVPLMKEKQPCVVQRSPECLYRDVLHGTLCCSARRRRAE